MGKLKEVVRLFILVLFLILAASGIGIGGIFHNRERYIDKEIRKEQVDKKEEDEDGEEAKS